MVAQERGGGPVSAPETTRAAPGEGSGFWLSVCFRWGRAKSSAHRHKGAVGVGGIAAVGLGHAAGLGEDEDPPAAGEGARVDQAVLRQADLAQAGAGEHVRADGRAAAGVDDAQVGDTLKGARLQRGQVGGQGEIGGAEIGQSKRSNHDVGSRCAGHIDDETIAVQEGAVGGGRDRISLGNVNAAIRENRLIVFGDVSCQLSADTDGALRDERRGRYVRSHITDEFKACPVHGEHAVGGVRARQAEPTLRSDDLQVLPGDDQGAAIGAREGGIGAEGQRFAASVVGDGAVAQKIGGVRVERLRAAHPQGIGYRQTDLCLHRRAFVGIQDDVVFAVVVTALGEDEFEFAAAIQVSAAADDAEGCRLLRLITLRGEAAVAG